MEPPDISGRSGALYASVFLKRFAVQGTPSRRGRRVLQYAGPPWRFAHRRGDSLATLSLPSGGVNDLLPFEQVVFERFWWDRQGESRPTQAPPGAGAGGAADRAVDWFVQTAGDALFFDGISVFPVRYLDDDLCVFEFKASGTLVVSQRVG